MRKPKSGSSRVRNKEKGVKEREAKARVQLRCGGEISKIKEKKKGPGKILTDRQKFYGQGKNPTRELGSKNARPT